MLLDTEWGKADLSSHCKLNPLKHFCRHPPSKAFPFTSEKERSTHGHQAFPSVRKVRTWVARATHTEVWCTCCPLVTFDFKKASAKGGPGFSSAKGVVVHGGVMSWSLGRQGPKCAAVSWSFILRGDEEGAEGQGANPEDGGLDSN